MLQCVCLLLLAASALGHLDETTLDHQWDEWKLTHRREYNGLVSVCRKRPPQCGMKIKNVLTCLGERNEDTGRICPQEVIV